jgi:hypothetical protein
MVELPGTVMPSKTIDVHAAVAVGIAVYAVTWQASAVALGVVPVETDDESVTALEMLNVGETGWDSTVVALLIVAVGFAPFKHVQALEILAGTLDHCAANAGRVCVGALV